MKNCSCLHLYVFENRKFKLYNSTFNAQCHIFYALFPSTYYMRHIDSSSFYNIKRECSEHDLNNDILCLHNEIWMTQDQLKDIKFLYDKENPEIIISYLNEIGFTQLEYPISAAHCTSDS